jgi:hypothetical protein
LVSLITGRWSHSSLLLSSGTILVMGGGTNSFCMNDVWQSLNRGATWTIVTANAGWAGKRTSLYHYLLEDGYIVL